MRASVCTALRFGQFVAQFLLCEPLHVDDPE